MVTVEHITSEIGVGTIIRGLGVKYSVIQTHKRAGLLPSSWYRFIEHECSKRGIDCPMSLFNFKGDFDVAS